MTRTLSGQMPGRVVALFLCNFCSTHTYLAPDGPDGTSGPDRWIGLGRDVHLCPTCAPRRRCAVGLLDKLAALPPSLLEVAVRIVDSLLRNEEAEFGGSGTK